MARSEKITKQELKEDRFVTLILEFYEFLKKNVKNIIISVGVIIVIIAAFSIYYHNRQQKEVAASVAMEEAIKLFEEAETAWINWSASCVLDSTSLRTERFAFVMV